MQRIQIKLKKTFKKTTLDPNNILKLMKHQSLIDGEHFVVFILCDTPIFGENRQVVTNEPVEFEK